MGIEAKVIADSISPEGKRLTTMVWRYPRFIHSEIMTHRMLSRNAASSRAIPVAKLLEQVRTDPALPVSWGKNRPGMQSHEELTGDGLFTCQDTWLDARDSAIHYVEKLVAAGLHKQVANRLLEPWMWMVTIVSATELGNFYNLRRHPDAQPEFKALADAAYAAHTASTPTPLTAGDWHLPFITEEERVSWGTGSLLQFSVARCARVSYLTHSGTTPDLIKDRTLHDQLIKAPHASPFEHQATPNPGRHGNFIGWLQYRQSLPNENLEKYPGL